MADEEKRRIYRSFRFPLFFVAILWFIRLADTVFGWDLNRFGLRPMAAEGLTGILTAPFLHGDFAHLFANTVPLVVLGAFLFYFYREIAWMILILIWLVTGFWVWVIAVPGTVHVGASGVIYGLVSFLFFSGLIRREKALLVITFLVAFLYGSLIWGIFPQLFPDQPISWESHLMGLIAGLILAVYYRNMGPQRQPWDWGDEEEDSEPPADIPAPGDPPPPGGTSPVSDHTSREDADIRYHPPEK